MREGWHQREGPGLSCMEDMWAEAWKPGLETNLEDSPGICDPRSPGPRQVTGQVPSAFGAWPFLDKRRLMTLTTSGLGTPWLSGPGSCTARSLQGEAGSRTGEAPMLSAGVREARPQGRAALSLLTQGESKGN